MRSRVALVLLALFVFLPACPKPQDDLRARSFVWTSAEPRAIDPTFVSDTPGAVVALNLFEGLYVAAPGDAPPRLGAARTHSVSADGLVHRFTLRDDLRWSDGRPVEAGDFVFAWRRMLDPATGAPGAEDLWRLKGGRDFHEGRLSDAGSVGARAEGAGTLVVTLAHPDPFFADALASSRFLPLPTHVVSEHGRRWTRPEHIVSNGPYRLAEWRPRVRLVLVRSETWHGAEDVHVARAVLRVVEGEELALRLYEAGEVDYTPGQVPFAALVRYRTEGRQDLRLDPYASVAYLAFNLRRPPFDDLRVRRAFVQAVDRRGLIAAVLRGDQEPATHLLPTTYRTLLGYEGPQGLGYDPEAARRELAAAGYPGGAGFPTVHLSCNTSDVLARMMAHIEQDLERHLGVAVEVVQSEWKSFLSAVQSGEFQLARYAMQGSVDPIDLLGVFRSGGANNIGGYASPRYDALLDAIQAEPDRERRLARMAEAETRLIADAALLPLYFYTRPALLRPRVEGFEAQSQDLHLLRYLRLTPE